MKPVIATLLLFFGIATVASAQQVQRTPLRFEEIVPTSATGSNCIGTELYRHVYESSKPAERGSLTGGAYPSFGWPLENPLHNGIILVNYVDNDNSSGILDYMGGAHAYDGHNGTDITLYNFRAMDRGMRVLAAADGRVVSTQYGAGDRNHTPPYPNDANYVTIEHPDGSYSWYYHFRRNSLTVNPGEEVKRGQVLGLAGSSGYSSDAHLHFETGEYVQGDWVKRDPWQGTYNTAPSLWMTQEPYMDTVPLRVYDLGIYTAAALDGDIRNLTYVDLKEGITPPHILGTDEEVLAFWLQLQGNAGESYTIEVLRPDGSQFATHTYTLPGKIQYGWHNWEWLFKDAVTAQEYGTWTARITSNGNVAREMTFEVGPGSVYRPRFWPLDGRSFRITGEPQRDTLRAATLGGPVTFRLLDAPSFVTLTNDSIITIGASSTQPYRSLYFQAIAMESTGLTDTMWYHIVDPMKPLDPITIASVDDRAAPALASGEVRCTPNPSAGTATIHYVLPDAGEVSLRVYNLLGEEVASLVRERQEPGAHSAAWRADGLPDGPYIYRLVAPGVAASGTLVLAR